MGIKCCSCGKFVSYETIGTDTSVEAIPSTAFTEETILFECIRCRSPRIDSKEEICDVQVSNHQKY